MDFFTAVKVKRRPDQEASPDNTLRLVYRIEKGLYQQLPAEDPPWAYHTCAVVGAHPQPKPYLPVKPIHQCTHH
jgi:hypothetical protein